MLSSELILLLPANRLHWYFNDECERSVMLAVLNPPEGVPSAFAVRPTSGNVTDGVWSPGSRSVMSRHMSCVLSSSCDAACHLHHTLALPA